MTCRLELYTGPHCELCEIAREMIYTTLPAGSYELVMVDITVSLALKKAYGLRIPVLRNPDVDQELGWPFSPEQLMAFLRQADE